MPAFNYKQEYERYRKYYLDIEPALKKPENQAYSAIIFSFLAVSLFGWYAIRPTMQTIFTLKREISDRTDVDKKMEDKISALIEAQASYQNIQDSIPLLVQALPPSSEPIRAVAQLQGLAQDTDVTMTGLSVPAVPLASPPKKTALPSAGNVASLDLSVTVSGAYTNVKSFLLGIQSLRRIMQISSMSFAPNIVREKTASGSASPASTSTVIQVDLKLKVFYLTP